MNLLPDGVIEIFFKLNITQCEFVKNSQKQKISDEKIPKIFIDTQPLSVYTLTMCVCVWVRVSVRMFKNSFFEVSIRVDLRTAIEISAK